MIVERRKVPAPLAVHDELKDQHLQMYKDLDWAALNAMVNKKP